MDMGDFGHLYLQSFPLPAWSWRWPPWVFPEEQMSRCAAEKASVYNRSFCSCFKGWLTPRSLLLYWNDIHNTKKLLLLCATFLTVHWPRFWFLSKHKALLPNFLFFFPRNTKMYILEVNLETNLSPAMHSLHILSSITTLVWRCYAKVMFYRINTVCTAGEVLGRTNGLHNSLLYFPWLEQSL